MINSAIADITGSTYEGGDLKGFNLPLLPPKSRFTDDTVLMVATADLLMLQQEAGHALDKLTKEDFARHYKLWGRQYPKAEYSPQFKAWLESDSLEPIYSLGSGVTSRVFPIAWMAESETQMMSLAANSANSTHEAPEAAVAACAVAYTCYHLIQGKDVDSLKATLEQKFFLPMEPNWKSLHESQSFSTNAEDVAGIGIAVGLTAINHEDALKLVLYAGGDTDTIGAVALAVMDARNPGYRIPPIEQKCRDILLGASGEPLLEVMDRFDRLFLNQDIPHGQ